MRLTTTAVLNVQPIEPPLPGFNALGNLVTAQNIGSRREACQRYGRGGKQKYGRDRWSRSTDFLPSAAGGANMDSVKPVGRYGIVP